MPNAIHRWKALTVLNPAMPEFKCVTRVSFELLPFKGLKLINISAVVKKGIRGQKSLRTKFHALQVLSIFMRFGAQTRKL